jgi:hypothetical protein
MILISFALSICSVVDPAPSRIGQALRDIGVTESVVLVAGLSREQVHSCIVSVTPQSLDDRDQAATAFATAELALDWAAASIETSPDPETALQQYQTSLANRDSAKSALDSANDAILLAVANSLDPVAWSALSTIRTTSAREVAPEYWTLVLDDSQWEDFQAAASWQKTQAPEVTLLRNASSEQIADSLEIDEIQHESDLYASTMQSVSSDPNVIAARARLTTRMTETRSIFDTGMLAP